MESRTHGTVLQWLKWAEANAFYMQRHVCKELITTGRRWGGHISGPQQLSICSIVWPYAGLFGTKDLLAFSLGAHKQYTCKALYCSVGYLNVEESLHLAEAARVFRRQWVLCGLAQVCPSMCICGRLFCTPKSCLLCDLYTKPPCSASSTSPASVHQLFGSRTWYHFCINPKICPFSHYLSNTP